MIYSTEPSITLKMIIDAGVIKAGVKVYSSLDKNIFGVLNSDGSISIKIKNKNRVFPFPSGAARAIENRSLNGWKYWTIQDSNEYKDLGFYRDIYIKKNDSSNKK